MKKYVCPEYLKDYPHACEEWDRIIGLLKKEKHDFQEKDLKALEAYCISYCKWRQANKILNMEGLTFKSPNGYIQQRPEVSIANKAEEEMRSWMKELGFTEASRARINKNAKQNVTVKLSSDEQEMLSLVDG